MCDADGWNDECDDDDADDFGWCLQSGHLADWVEPAVRDRSKDRCEYCGTARATDLCTHTHLRPLAEPDEVLHLCRSCHLMHHGKLVGQTLNLQQLMPTADKPEVKPIRIHRPSDDF